MEGYESRREESIIMFFFRPPKKTKPQGKSIFLTVDKNKPVQLQLYQFNVFCTSSEKIVLKEKIVLQHTYR